MVLAYANKTYISKRSGKTPLRFHLPNIEHVRPGDQQVLNKSPEF